MREVGGQPDSKKQQLVLTTVLKFHNSHVRHTMKTTLQMAATLPNPPFEATARVRIG